MKYIRERKDKNISIRDRGLDSEIMEKDSINNKVNNICTKSLFSDKIFLAKRFYLPAPVNQGVGIYGLKETI